MRIRPKQSEALSSLLCFSPVSREAECTLLLEPSTLIVLEASSSCEQVLGMPLERIVGRVLTTLPEETCREDLSKALRLASRRSCPRQFSSRWKLDGGRIVQVDILACPLNLSDDRMVLQVVAIKLPASSADKSSDERRARLTQNPEAARRLRGSL